MRLSLRRGGIIAASLFAAACATSMVETGPFPAEGKEDAGKTDDETPAGVEDAGVTRDTGTTKDTGTAKDTGAIPDTGGSETSLCAKAPPSNLCGLAPQCGCPAGETCDVTGTGGETRCIPAGTAAMGRACTTTAGCALGYGCWGGVCRPYCANAGQACGVAGTNQCLQLTNNGTPVPNLKVCLINCAIDDPNSCGGLTPAGQPVAGCEPVTANGQSVTDCMEVGRSTTSCDPPNEQWCAPGYACVTGNVCKRWCKVGGGTCTCNSLSPKVVVSGQEYGVCSN